MILHNFIKKKYIELHDSSAYKFLDLSSPILFLIITVTPTHVRLKHVRARGPRARTARALKVEWPSHPHPLQKRRARHVRPQPILRGGNQTGPISVVLSYAASNPSYVIGDVSHLLSPCRWSRARVIFFGAILVRFPTLLFLFLSFRIEPAVSLFLLFVGSLVWCRRSAPLAREDTSLNPLEANLIAPTALLRIFGFTLLFSLLAGCCNRYPPRTGSQISWEQSLS